MLEKPQEHRRYGGIWLFVYAPARRIVIGQGKPVMTGSGNHHIFDLSALIAERGNKPLRLVVMNYRILIAVDHEIARAGLSVNFCNRCSGEKSS